jgi:hypothetical protein
MTAPGAPYFEAGQEEEAVARLKKAKSTSLAGAMGT